MELQHPNLLLQHRDKNTCKLQYSSRTDETFRNTPETYMYSHYNMCNIPIYFCNINIQHLQHTSETLEIYYSNMHFSVASACCFDEWRLIDADLDAVEWHGGSWCGARQQNGPRQEQGRWIELGRDGRRESRRCRWHSRGQGLSRRKGAQRAERAGDAGRRHGRGTKRAQLIQARDEALLFLVSCTRTCWCLMEKL
jgi:hypothetical protein